ncbi:MAG: hypothetical protein J0I06_13065 [Planctomycetes bacterium]|nr:hypothetical protein [Planctomycetota bacterium]
MKTRLPLVLALALTLSLPVAAAPPTPRDEALRLAPDAFALVAVVQNLRDHTTAVSESPFASWFPTTPLGKQILGGANFKQITDSATPLFGALGITPSDLLHDVIGDAAVFAFTPAAPTDPSGERSIILVRPRKPDTLVKVIERLNDVQTKSKELKALVEHKHAGETYFERQKPNGPSDFYCFRDGVFAFSASETEIKAVIDRDKAAPRDKPSVLAARMTKLGVTDAAVVLLVNPRPLDAELAAKVKNARPDEKAFLTKFAEVWAAADAAALYLQVGAAAELGVSLQFDPAKVPAGARAWLVGERTPSAVWAAVPDDAIAAVAGRVRPNDLFTFLDSLNADDGKFGARATIEQALGPLIGKDKLPLVLDALGPDWGAWVAPPAKGSTDSVPAAVTAIKVRTDAPRGAEAAKALVQSLEYGFQVARIAYNAKHKDQLELREEADGDTVVRSLAGEGLPAGFRPSFALKGGYLLISTSPDAIKAFRPPTAEPKPGGDVPFARFSATAARGYLESHSAVLAKLLSAAGAGDEKGLADQFDMLARVLEPVDTVELVARGDATGVKLSLRVKPAKSLKK